MKNLNYNYNSFNNKFHHFNDKFKINNLKTNHLLLNSNKCIK